MMDALRLPDATKPVAPLQRQELSERSIASVAPASRQSLAGRWKLGTILVFLAALVAAGAHHG